MEVPLIAKDILCYIKHWIYSWQNSMLHFTEEEFKFLKHLLLYIVQTNKDIEILLLEEKLSKFLIG